MGGAAGEQQLYLRQPLPTPSGQPVMEGLCQLGSWGLSCGLKSPGALFLCWESLPDCKSKV